MMADLFDSIGGETEEKKPSIQPLAEQLRPKSFDDVIGQDHLLGENGPLGSMLKAGRVSSIILWGPPGVGKTTIARMLADQTSVAFVQISALSTGAADLRKVFDAAEIRHRNGRSTLLFVDEIHSFNKKQQDLLLPYMESGVISLVGATTENPSFSLNSAILSRSQVLTLNALDEDALLAMVGRAESILDVSLPLTDDAKRALVALAHSDGRTCINLVEQVLNWNSTEPVDAEELQFRLSRRAANYDKGGDGHFQLASALQKCIRGSDHEAAIYWLHRMLDAGEDPRFIARRLLMIAYEDVGQADPQAAVVALTAWQTYERLGSPEGDAALSQAALYLALAPKSIAGYKAHKASRVHARETRHMPPPKHIVNAPTQMMKDQGFKDGYIYDHDAPDGFSGQNFLPEGMPRPQLYQPVERGFEREMKKRVTYYEELRRKRN